MLAAAGYLTVLVFFYASQDALEHMDYMIDSTEKGRKIE